MDDTKPEAGSDERRRTSQTAESHLAEISEDLLDMLERLTALDAAVASVAARFDALEARFENAVDSLGTDVRSMHRDLLGDRQAMASRSVYFKFIPRLDSVREVRRRLPAESEDSVGAQLDAVIYLMETAVQDLGFERFEVDQGSIFDPTCMECTGYGDGEAGTVLAVERLGYRAGETIVRPVGVRLARSSAAGGADMPCDKE